MIVTNMTILTTSKYSRVAQVAVTERWLWQGWRTQSRLGHFVNLVKIEIAILQGLRVAQAAVTERWP